jgi:RNA polymerase sigma-70 factor (family 1)
VNSTDPADDKLLHELRLGSRDAYEAIFNKYWYALFKVAYARTKSKEEAEEIVQEIFAGLWKNHQTLLISHLSFYLFAAVRKRVISAIRSRMVHDKYRNHYEQFLKGHALVTEEAVAFTTLREAVEKAVCQLPEKPQQVFRLSHFQGLSVPEISKHLNMPRRTIEHHLTQSLRTLRVHLKDFILFLFILAQL